VVCALAALSALYSGLARRRILTWGATEAEGTSRLPGDELLENADGVSTRAISIDAPAAVVWPWLAPMVPRWRMSVELRSAGATATCATSSARQAEETGRSPHTHAEGGGFVVLPRVC
jgi:hypothetical protein